MREIETIKTDFRRVKELTENEIDCQKIIIEMLYDYLYWRGRDTNIDLNLAYKFAESRYFSSDGAQIKSHRLINIEKNYIFDPLSFFAFEQLFIRIKKINFYRIVKARTIFNVKYGDENNYSKLLYIGQGETINKFENDLIELFDLTKEESKSILDHYQKDDILEIFKTEYIIKRDLFQFPIDLLYMLTPDQRKKIKAEHRITRESFNNLPF